MRLKTQGVRRFLRLILASTVAAISMKGFAETSTTVSPYSHVVKRGTVSRAGVDSIVVRDQSGSRDDWLSYLEFYPGTQGYAGIFNFDMPRNISERQLDKIELLSNFRGPTRAEQSWRWYLFDFPNRRWSKIGDNASASNWDWSSIRAQAGGSLADYVNQNGKLRVLYTTPSNTDNSNVDYLALRIKTSSPENDPPNEDSPVWRPRPGTSWQWQLKGTIDTSFDVQMYDIDLFDTPRSTIASLQAQGRKVVCYFSAGSWENWRPDAGQFPARVRGRDNGWPGEKWLDIRALDVLAPIMKARLDLARSKGCDGVEPDNVDGYANNTNFPLSDQDQLRFNIWLANAAHARGLSIGLKNDLDQVQQLEPYFDWAINEQCYQYQECDLLSPFVAAGKAVFGVEYSGNPQQFCPELNALNFDWLKKDINLTAYRLACR